MKHGNLLEHNTLFHMGIKEEQKKLFWVNCLGIFRSVEGNYAKMNLASMHKLTSVSLQNKCHRCFNNE